MRWSPPIRQPPRPAGRGKGERPDRRSTSAPRSWASRCARPTACAASEEQAAFARARGRCRGGRRLRADPAAADPRRAEAAAASTSTPRCCRAGAGRRRSSARSWPATRSPASPSCRWRPGSTPGRCCSSASVAIDDKNAGQLTEELAKLGARADGRSARRLPSSEPIPQPEDGVTYAAKIGKEEARIDWSRPADEVVRQVRAFAPVPGAWFEANGERIKLLDAERGRGVGRAGRGARRSA